MTIKSSCYLRFVRTVLLVTVCSYLWSCGGKYTKQVSEVTGTVKFLDPNAATQKTDGFETLSINDRGVMEFTLLRRLGVPEFEAPVVQSSEVVGKKTNLIGAAIGTVLTGGLYPLIESKSFFENALGQQTDVKVLDITTEKGRAVATNRVEWISVPLTEVEIEIQGLGKPIRQKVTAATPGKFRIDLSNQLFNWALTNQDSFRVQVVCVSCESNAKDQLVSSQKSINFQVPKIWQMLALTQRKANATWAADRGILGLDTNSEPRAGWRNSVTWQDVFSEIQKRSEAQLRKMAELPKNIVNENTALLRSRPSSAVELTRDEFESKDQFDARLREAILSQKRKVAEFNRQVEVLDKKFKQFQSEIPKKLNDQQQIQIINETISDLAGDPVVNKVVYDPDVRRFIIKVAGARQGDRSDLVFNMVTSDEIDSQDARELKQKLFNARVFVNFSLTEKSISPKSAQLVINNRILEMKYVDRLELPVLQTVRMEPENLIPFPTARRVEPSSVAATELVLAEDLESVRLRERLSKLRADISAKPNTVEKDLMREEIRSIEAKIKKMDEGDFIDDLNPLIQKIPAKPKNGNVLAMVTGIAEYGELPAVVFADRSARSFSELIQRKYGIESTNLDLLTNQEATGVRWMERLQAIAKRATENDTLILYYAGHGAPTPSGRTTSLVPQDSSGNISENSAFRLSEIYKLLLNSRAKEIIVVLDTCFSGRTDNGASIFKDVAPVFSLQPAGIEPPANQRMTVLSGGGPTDFSLAFRPKGHRLFTYHLLKEWAGTLGNLRRERFDVVAKAVTQDAYASKQSFEQHPQWIGGGQLLSK